MTRAEHDAVLPPIRVRPQGKRRQRAPRRGEGTATTSKAAADSVRQTVAHRRTEVLHVIRQFGPCSDADVQRITGLDGSSVRPRRVELLEMGLIADSGERGLTPSRRRCVKWVATEAGKQAVQEGRA